MQQNSSCNFSLCEISIVLRHSHLVAQGSNTFFTRGAKHGVLQIAKCGRVDKVLRIWHSEFLVVFKNIQTSEEKIVRINFAKKVLPFEFDLHDNLDLREDPNRFASLFVFNVCLPFEDFAIAHDDLFATSTSPSHSLTVPQYQNFLREYIPDASFSAPLYATFDACLPLSSCKYNLIQCNCQHLMVMAVAGALQTLAASGWSEMKDVKVWDRKVKVLKIFLKKGSNQYWMQALGGKKPSKMLADSWAISKKELQKRSVMDYLFYRLLLLFVPTRFQDLFVCMATC